MKAGVRMANIRERRSLELRTTMDNALGNGSGLIH